MPTGNTSLLGLALPVNGELNGTWGTVVNTSITELVDSAVAGTTTLSADSDVTLTDTVLAANQARQAVILWTASNGATTRNITAPARSKAYIVVNAGTGSVVLRGAGPTTGVTIISGERCLAAWNGSDFVKIATSTVDGVATFSAGTTGFTPSTATSGAVTLAGTLATTNGGTGLTSFTSGGVVYASSTSALTTGSALTFDGTNLGIGATTPLQLLHLSSASPPGMQITYQGVGAARIGIAAGNALTFGLDTSNGATEQMRLTSTGLGIGTSSPAFKLDVAGSAARLSNGGVGGPTLFLNNTSGTSFKSQITLASNGSGKFSFGLDAAGGGVNNLFWYDDVAGATRMTLDSSGNLGLGVTPTGQSKFQVYTGNNAINGIQTQFNGSNPPIALASTTSNGFPYVGFNTVQVVNSDNQTYATSGFASRISHVQGGNGGFQFNVAPSGTAGNAISFTQAMTLDASGNLLVGSTSVAGAERLNIVGGAGIRVNEDGSGTKVIGIRSNFAGVGPAINVASNDPLLFLTNNTERARISSAGGFMVGTVTDPGAGLIADVAGNVRAIPPAGAAKTGSYTLVKADVGDYVEIASGGSVTVPTSVFAAGDAVAMFNNTTGNITITCSAPTAYVGGTNTVRTSVTLATRGVCNVLFISPTLCVITGNVS